eukprot:scaffold120986_cov33-Tisochrysis_lutea.AAC.2
MWNDTRHGPYSAGQPIRRCPRGYRRAPRDLRIPCSPHLFGEQVSAAEFAARFSVSEDEASIFLAWINVGVAFKEQYMTDASTASRKTKKKAKALARRAGIL